MACIHHFTKSQPSDILIYVNMKISEDDDKKTKMPKALSVPSREVIYAYLRDHGECCACKLLSVASCRQATLSHHMAVLVDSGLVDARKDGKWVRYSLNARNRQKLFQYLRGTDENA
jgi:ArsR family transcriptional regulator, arsenate/arsenite/antimonite-responsive transcriptional repressor